MKLKIKVTKEVLKKAMYCGTDDKPGGTPSENCAIALAVRDLFPKARVFTTDLSLTEFLNNYIPHSPSTMYYILKFDSLSETPEKRLELPEYEFEIEVPEDVINSIGLEQVYSILKDHKTLEIV